MIQSQHNAQRQQFFRSSGAQAVLQKTDRILGVPDVTVEFDASSIPAPAYTDGRKITINTSWDPVKESLTKGFSPKSVMIMTGLNYHELAHCLFTPRMDSELTRNVKNQASFPAFNILEDQLAETRFVRLYEPARHYFSALVSHYMLNATVPGVSQEELLKHNYPLVAGRLFLPQGMRDKFREAFVDQKKLDDIDAIISEYKALIHPQDDIRMEQLIVEFQRLLTPETQNLGSPHDHIMEGEVSQEQSRRSEEQQEVVNTDGRADKNEPKESEGEDDTEEDESSGKDGEREQEGEEEPSEQNSSGSSTEEQDQEDDLQGLLEELSDTINDAASDMQDELEDRIQSIKHEAKNYQINQQEAPRSTEVPRPELNRIVNDCVDAFRQVQLQHSPGWHHEQRQGKLDPKKYARALRGDDRIYKRWNEGVHDALDFEVVFLLDQSGSMAGSEIAEASRALWILRRTFDECDGVTTSVGFSMPEEIYLLSQRYERASRHEIPLFETVGSTFLASGIEEASRILSISRKKIRFAVVITDGMVHDYDEVERIMESDLQFKTAFLGINSSVDSYEDQSGVIHTQTIKSPMEIVDVVKNLALRLSEENMRSYA